MGQARQELTWRRLLEDVATAVRGVELWNHDPTSLPAAGCDMYAAPWIEVLDEEQATAILGEACATFDWKEFSASTALRRSSDQIGKDERGAIRGACQRTHRRSGRPVLSVAQADELISKEFARRQLHPAQIGGR